MRSVSPEDEAYERFVLSTANSFAYASSRYLQFIRRLMPDAEVRVLAAIDGQQIAGVLPCVVDRSVAEGAVIASLPWCSSNGGIIAADGAPTGVYRALLGALDDLALEVGARSAAIITSPLGDLTDRHTDLIDPHSRSRRLGQWTRLPGYDATTNRAGELWDRLHSKTRNAVRRAQRSVEIRPAGSEAEWEAFVNLHKGNLSRLGGRPKSQHEIAALRSAFEPEALQLTVAARDGQIVAGVLFVMANRTAEYLIPAFDETQKDTQALSGTIWSSLEVAIEHDCAIWNWGGTHLDQEGVRRFKERWGAESAPYEILTRIYDETVLELSAATLQESFPYSFVVPYAALSS